jgi:hypothetical protein
MKKENKKGRGERGGSHYMAIEKVLVTIKENQKRRGENLDGWLWQLKSF